MRKSHPFFQFSILNFQFSILLLLLTSCASKESAVEPFNLNGTCWTDGYEFFVGQPDTITHDSSLYLFIGGNLHEGGYGFALQRLTPDTFLIQTIPGTPMVAVGVVGDTVVLLGTQASRLQANGIDSLKMLVCYRPDDPEADTLWQYDPGDLTPYEAYGRLLHQGRLNELKGVYTDAKNGMTFEFADTLLIRTPKGGKSDTASFQIFYSFDMPTHALILSTKEKLWYEKTAIGLDLFTAKYWIAEDDYSQDQPLYRLTRQ